MLADRVIVEVRGVNGPGRRCNPAPKHGPYEDVHVGVGHTANPIGVVSGDMPEVQWRIPVRVVHDNGILDFRGPNVDGKRGDRYIYLNWFNREPDGQLRLFRRGKVMLEGVDLKLVEQAGRTGAPLRCTVNLSNAKGLPTTARFRAAELDWRVALDSE